jgi:HSP20 family molecular chaperone IbpA
VHARADLIEDKDAYNFYFDMPGLKADSLDVQMEDDQLTVAGGAQEARMATGNRDSCNGKMPRSSPASF